MDKLKMHSPDLTQDNIARLRELFPGCVTEAQAEDGSVTLAVDFDQLRQELSASLVEGPQERYQLNWPGKREALLTANAPIAKTLRPVREESVDFDTTKNLFIEGDNLDALKLLQETYLGKVKLIYIDPPYNTGGDFIYKDDFSSASVEHELASGERNSAGGRLITNPSSNGRFHSDWLSMMYPRIRLSRVLLEDDGILLVSINDVEQANLKKICDEVFGEDALVAQFVWNNEGNVDQQSKIKGVHEYILAYCKDINAFSRPTVIDPNIEESSKLYNDTIENSITKNGPANPESILVLPVGFPAKFNEGTLEPRDDKFPKILDRIEVADGKLVRSARVSSGWSSRNLIDLFIKNGCVPIRDSEGKETWFDLTESGAIYGYKKRADDQGHVLSVIRNVGTTKQNSGMLARWGLKFSYPKPVFLIQYLVSIFTSDKGEHIVLDFFAGSGTTGDAVLRQNSEDGGSRRFILVQFPEEISATSGNAAGINTIADISKQRLRECGKSVLLADPHASWTKDVGFRVLSNGTSNMADVYYKPDIVTQDDLIDAVDNIKPDRDAEDLLFQVMLDWGVDLALPIDKKAIHGKDVYFVDSDALAACFDKDGGIDDVFAKDLATHKPLRVVFRDAGFKDSAVKINIEQIFKLLSPSTEVRCL